MKTIRHTPRAIQEPLLVMGIERTLLTALFIVCALVAGKLSRPLAIVIFLGTCAAAKAASRKDPNLLNTAQEAWKLKSVYDPINRRPFKVVLDD